MSLILDALNRSREDTGEVPGLATRHQFADDKPDRRATYLGVALLGALALIGWLLWDRGEEPGTGEATAMIQDAADPEPAAVAPVQAEPAAVESGTDRSGTSAVARESVVRDKPAEIEAPAQVAEKPVQAAAATGPGPGVEEPVNPAVDALYGDPVEQEPNTGAGNSAPEIPPDSRARAQAVAPNPATVKPVPEKRAPVTQEQDINIEQLVRQAEDQLENARLEEHAAPFVNELSQRTKDSIPTVYYERHEYSGRPGQSRVVLNGKPLKKGGSPVSGMTVEEILPDSVVLDYRGTQFRLRALNSWVNL